MGLLICELLEQLQHMGSVKKLEYLVPLGISFWHSALLLEFYPHPSLQRLSPLSVLRCVIALSLLYSVCRNVSVGTPRRKEKRAKVNLFAKYSILLFNTVWRSWLRYCATSRKAAVSIPDAVIGIFRWVTISGHTMALWAVQPLTRMNTSNISWG